MKKYINIIAEYIFIHAAVCEKCIVRNFQSVLECFQEVGVNMGV